MIILQLALYCALFTLIWIAGAAVIAGLGTLVLLFFTAWMGLAGSTMLVGKK